MGKSYSSSWSQSDTTTISKPTTIGAEGEAMVVTDGSSITMIDEDAIERSFDFAKSVFETQTDTTKKMMDFMNIQNAQEDKQQEEVYDFIGQLSDPGYETGETSTLKHFFVLAIVGGISFFVYKKLF